MIRVRVLAVLILLVAGGCASPVPPRTQVFAPIDVGAEQRLYVSTNDEREAVLAALRQAGFAITEDLQELPFVLTVRLGSRRSTSACGAVRNAVFQLMHSGVQIAVIKGRGSTGSCDPNILLDMSAELARLFPRPA